MSSPNTTAPTGALIATAGSAGVIILGAPPLAVGAAVVLVAAGIGAGIYSLFNRE